MTQIASEGPLFECKLQADSQRRIDRVHRLVTNFDNYRSKVCADSRTIRPRTYLWMCKLRDTIPGWQSSDCEAREKHEENRQITRPK